jgi:hypothetical protein
MSWISRCIEPATCFGTFITFESAIMADFWIWFCTVRYGIPVSSLICLVISNRLLATRLLARLRLQKIHAEKERVGESSLFRVGLGAVG